MPEKEWDISRVDQDAWDDWYARQLKHALQLRYYRDSGNLYRALEEFVLALEFWAETLSDAWHKFKQKYLNTSNATDMVPETIICPAFLVAAPFEERRLLDAIEITYGREQASHLTERLIAFNEARLILSNYFSNIYLSYAGKHEPHDLVKQASGYIRNLEQHLGELLRFLDSFISLVNINAMPASTAGLPNQPFTKARGDGRALVVKSRTALDRVALKCFFMWSNGKTQADIALELFGDRSKQPKVNRLIKKAQDSLQPLGVDTSALKPEKTDKPILMDPRKLDVGPRSRGRTSSK
ncbi:MAG: hypothetical protein RLN76_07180 [Phycisphaeraceae bacterium]